MGGKKLRMTNQRKIILEELEKTCEHPSAAEVYEKVKQRLPHISLGTVYRNLEVLSATGVIKRLSIAGGQRRFDAGMYDHHHIRCVSCGRVEDVPSDEGKGFKSLTEKVSRTSGYVQMGCAVDFYGICPDCVKAQTREADKKNTIRHTLKGGAHG